MSMFSPLKFKCLGIQHLESGRTHLLLTGFLHISRLAYENLFPNKRRAFFFLNFCFLKCINTWPQKAQKGPYVIKAVIPLPLR